MTGLGNASGFAKPFGMNCCPLFYFKCSLFINRGYKIFPYFMTAQIFLHTQLLKKNNNNKRSLSQSLGICGWLETSLCERRYSLDREHASRDIKKTCLLGLPIHLMRLFSLSPPFRLCCPINGPTSPGGCSSCSAH